MLNRSNLNEIQSDRPSSGPSLELESELESPPQFLFPRRPVLLYVDDNTRSSRLLTSVLEDSGFRVVAKDDPVEALLLCRHTYFDLALVDYEMPKMNGGKLAREIKYLVPDVPVVMISSQVELPAEAMEFVDAHFGFATDLDDLLWSLRVLSRGQAVYVNGTELQLRSRQQPDAIAQSRWADST